MAKRIGILAAIALTFALAACTNPTAPAAQPHVGTSQMSAGTLIGADT